MSVQGDYFKEHLKYPVWLGALGKCWIANLVLATVEKGVGGSVIRVLDLGSGPGSGWVDVLNNCPDLDVTLWDPDLSEAIPNPIRDLSQVTFVDSLESVKSKFNFVTSMSVVEHVHDLQQHLGYFAEFLANNGVGILLWDDGHFRPEFDMRQPVSSGSLAIKELTKWALSVVFGRLIPPNLYQRRRSMRDVVESAESAGLTVVGSTFVGLRGLKHIVGNEPEEMKLGLLNLWLKFEQDFLRSLKNFDAQFSSLERVFTSRLVLVQKVNG